MRKAAPRGRPGPQPPRREKDRAHGRLPLGSPLPDDSLESRRPRRRRPRPSARRWPSSARAYWYPIYALIRRKGHDADAALDLTQDYFARLLEKGTVAAADPDKGRFRSFLLADCSFFLADRRDRDRALKRGGGGRVLSIDARDAEGRFLREPSYDRTPERMFERDWALALIARVFDAAGTALRRHGAVRAVPPPEAPRVVRPALTLPPVLPSPPGWA